MPSLLALLHANLIVSTPKLPTAKCAKILDCTYNDTINNRLSNRPQL